MSGRDRIVAMVLVVLVVIAAGWMLLVSPERKEADKLQTQVQTAQGEVTTAEGQLADARAAQAKYSSAYAAIVNMGKAVPATQEVASLIYELEGVTNKKRVAFDSIASSGSGSSSGPGSTPAATAAGFTQLPFTFTFEGGFFDLEHLFAALTAFTTHDGSGGLEVSGRLLTVQSVKLAPAASSQPGSSSQGSSSKLTGTITASAYVLPAGAGLTGGATPSSPTGEAGASPATSSAAGSSTPAAVARVTP
jgi:Tfp pilus assembly protein PilO